MSKKHLLIRATGLILIVFLVFTACNSSKKNKTAQAPAANPQETPAPNLDSVEGRTFLERPYKGSSTDFHETNQEFIQFDSEGHGTVLYGDIVMSIKWQQQGREITYRDQPHPENKEPRKLILSEDKIELLDPKSGKTWYRDKNYPWPEQ